MNGIETPGPAFPPPWPTPIYVIHGTPVQAPPTFYPVMEPGCVGQGSGGTLVYNGCTNQVNNPISSPCNPGLYTPSGKDTEIVPSTCPTPIP